MLKFAFNSLPLLLLVITSSAVARTSLVPEIPCNTELVDAQLAQDLEITMDRLSSLDGVKQALTRLAKVARTGWVRRGVPKDLQENVLDHSKKVFQAALLFPKREGLNRKKMALMGFFHDIAEYEVPDYTPQDNVTKEQKYREERAAIRKMIRKTSEGGKVLLDLWEEYRTGRTPEARIVSQLDKLDAAVQSFEYLKMGFNVSDFIPYVEGKLTEPVLVETLQKLKSSFHGGNAYALYFELLKAANPPAVISN